MATILIVDDLSANRDFLATFLRSHEHRLLEASDGREGLDVVQAEHPDLVITDVLMRVMDGYELLRQLRLDRRTSGIPVVIYTAHYGEREARALALSSGVSDVSRIALVDPGLRQMATSGVVFRALAGPGTFTETGVIYRRNDPSTILSSFLQQLRGTLSRPTSVPATAPTEGGKATRRPKTTKVPRRPVGRGKK